MTGANGFIGSHLCAELVRRGHAVKAVVQPGTGLENLDGIHVELARADLRDVPSLHRAVQGAEVVFHLAAYVSDYGPRQTFDEINVRGTERLVEAAIAAGARRLLFMSSLAVHAYRGHPAGDEETPRDQEVFEYGRSKRRGEEILERAWASGRIETVIVRPGLFPFGPRDRAGFARIAAALEGGRFAIVNGGRAVICTAYVENLAEGVALAGEHPRAAGRIYVLSDGRRVTWRQVLEAIAQALRKPCSFTDFPSSIAYPAAVLWERLSGVVLPGRDPMLTRYRVAVAARDLFFDAARARRDLGWQPRVGFEDALERSVQWYRSSRSRTAA
ncbi:MAG: NAD-dependent epimerase/dehydratase family protein [Deltaproteobacteria bacterium]|nr:NAD-dependent epimerase/dehydratase family protein [Deltaproteobacteria bacterium]